MPIYDYRCANGHQFEVLQKVSEAPPAACETCDAPVERVFHPVAVHFKGSGFYTTDYGRKKGKGEKGEAKAGDSGAKSSADSSAKDKSSTSTSKSKSD